MQFINKEFVAQQELQQELQQVSLYSRVLRVLAEGKPFSIKEISEQLGQKDVSGQLIRVIKKLVEDKLVTRTFPDVRNHPGPKHIITEPGQLFLKLLVQQMSSKIIQIGLIEQQKPVFR